MPAVNQAALEIFTNCGVQADEMIGGLGNDRTGEGLRHAMEGINNYADVYIDAMQALIFAQGGVELACRSGCSFCCHGPVHLTPVELLHIMLYLDSDTITPQQRTAHRERVDVKYAAIDGMSTKTQIDTAIPCPFLVEHCCSIYTVRPLFCRGRNSLSSISCQTGYERPDIPLRFELLQEQMLIGQSLVMGILAALHKIGLPAQSVDLSLAMKAAFDTSDVVTRWLGGENILQPAEATA